MAVYYKRYFRNRYIDMAMIALYLFFIVPFILVAFYAGPSADDFSNLHHTLSSEGNTFFGKAIYASVDTYMKWQGTYFGNAFTFIGGAIYHYGGLAALRCEYIINILFFFTSCTYFFWRLVGMVFTASRQRIRITLLIATIFNLMILHGFDVSEVFYWHTGLGMYTIPLSCALLSIGIALKHSISIIDMVVAITLAVAASGGALDISAFVTGSLCLIVAYRICTTKKMHQTAYVFIAALIGSLINVIAPGNYVRHAVISDEFPVLGSFKYGVVNTFEAQWEYVGNGTIIIVFCLCICLYNMLKEQERIKYINPFLLMLILFWGSVIIDFPVYLGYSLATFPLRVLFVRRVTMVIFFIVWALNLTGWISKRLGEELAYKKEFIAVVIGLVVVSFALIFPQNVWTTVNPFKMWHDLCINESLTAYKDTNDYILNELKAGNNTDVVISVDAYDTLGYLKSIGLTGDPNYWVNTEVAAYFQNKSVVFYLNAQ